MTRKDYSLLSMAIWRSGAIVDKNAIRQQARERMRKLIATDIAYSIHHENKHFDPIRFLNDCSITPESEMR